jgi:hypothetical protein
MSEGRMNVIVQVFRRLAYFIPVDFNFLVKVLTFKQNLELLGSLVTEPSTQSFFSFIGR